LADIKAHLYSNILVLQEIDSATQLPRWRNQKLDPRFKLQPLKEIQIQADRYLRISRLIK
jgi:hypothetical protein